MRDPQEFLSALLRLWQPEKIKALPRLDGPLFFLGVIYVFFWVLDRASKADTGISLVDFIPGGRIWYGYARLFFWVLLVALILQKILDFFLPKSDNNGGSS